MGAAIVGVDFEKAYDLVNREVLWRILDVMGYPVTFARWLQTIAFVDDVTIFVSCDEDFTRAGQVLDLFCQWTKARMNKEKTKALGLGTWSSRLIWPLEWLVSASTLSLLGIKFSHSIVETAGRVWNDAFGSLNVERPKKIVIYRTVKQGGLGMVNTHLFYRSLFLCPVYKVLTGPSSPESSLLRYWMSFPLRTLLPLYKDNTTPVAVMKRPYYLQEPLHQIKQLFASSILVQGNPMVHGKTYNHWILEVITVGKLEILRPNLDWPRIWKETAALPSNICTHLKEKCNKLPRSVE
ncbi:hypothetical protein GHT06_018633 [Daphnia sinensis]|uniref:Reverse transcriptase domain-containing protein n=1 Tax=Daphnia sinensis TaxID=1820382 RepID=A0AAD5PQD2_9CRUS|nr:hypothetical protein GHT06_018633 [Daphnia sinensis]